MRKLCFCILADITFNKVPVTMSIFYLLAVGEVDVKLSHEHNEFTWIDLRQPLPDDIQEKPLRAALILFWGII